MARYTVETADYSVGLLEGKCLFVNRKWDIIKLICSKSCFVVMVCLMDYSLVADQFVFKKILCSRKSILKAC